MNSSWWARPLSQSRGGNRQHALTSAGPGGSAWHRQRAHPCQAFSEGLGKLPLCRLCGAGRGPLMGAPSAPGKEARPRDVASSVSCRLSAGLAPGGGCFSWLAQDSGEGCAREKELIGGGDAEGREERAAGICHHQCQTPWDIEVQVELPSLFSFICAITLADN